MKKLTAIIVMLMMLLALTLPAEAASKAPGLPNLKSEKTITAMKKGTKTFNGVKLGDTVTTAKAKWGKPAYAYTSINKYYDYGLTYDIETDDDYDTHEIYFTGKRGVTKANYKLNYIEYSGSSLNFKYKDMLRYWKKADFTYISGETENYIYGQTILVYDENDGAFMGYKYADKATITAIKKAFSK
ncbi:hypothetical protein [Macrococcus lamae]|uniref:DUF4367 domain-containing protein n=1 Tax=Macrococcus lamae TaxID=198484 RepID=A0A4R6BSH8_9STAP|nr:hypothetical protein [Macrococcus lamae]TDM06993.1 hypothetical protein ERX29_09795 [Macrococcus lamae]